MKETGYLRNKTHNFLMVHPKKDAVCCLTFIFLWEKKTKTHQNQTVFDFEL